MAREANARISRRAIIQTGVVAAGFSAVGGVSEASPLSLPLLRRRKPTVRIHRNSEFYDSTGGFLPEKAKSAYFEMMERFNYPITERLRKDMWASDFGLGDFVNVGMGGIFWLNRKEFGYFGHEIFLLPGQQIPEHAHLASKDGPAKMESWQVRHGMIYTFGEGEETKPLPLRLPESQEAVRTVKHCEPLRPGEVRDLNRITAFHFMIGGPEGAIVTEYATYHDNAGLRFANPKVKF